MASVGGLGSLLGPMLVVLGRFGPYVGGLGPLLGPMFAVLGPLGTYVGSLRPLLGPMLAVLGRSWGLCRRSGAALGPYVGGLGSLLGPMLAVWAALGASECGLGTGSGRKAAQTRKSGPNPSGNRVPKGSGWEAGKPGSWEGPDRSEGPARIFSVDICIPSPSFRGGRA